MSIERIKCRKKKICYEVGAREVETPNRLVYGGVPENIARRLRESERPAMDSQRAIIWPFSGIENKVFTFALPS
jgi:hypothetical protein